MIKFRATSKTGRPVIGIGLSFRNLELLKQQRPIYINGQEIGVACDVIVLAGETEGALVAEFREHGVEMEGV